MPESPALPSIQPPAAPGYPPVNSEEELKLFFGPDWVITGDSFKNTDARIMEQGVFKLRDIPPAPTPNYSMRIGGTQLYVPPTSVGVSQSFRAGSMSGAALRQPNSPKFNTGYSDTVINLTLYFPNHELIWGFDGGELLINFEDPNQIPAMDKFMSSLRGLITQFKFAPFLPIRNTYLNQTYGITAVALQSMTVSTLPEFPFCVVVQLTLLKFNHQVYLPMVEDFDNAIHWGKFRQYIGRAAGRLSALADKKFFTAEDMTRINADTGESQGRPIDFIRDPYVTPGTLSGAIALDEGSPNVTFSKTTDLSDGRIFDIYYPYQSPIKSDVPDLENFLPDTVYRPDSREWWRSMLRKLGINPADPVYDYDKIEQETKDEQSVKKLAQENNFILNFLAAAGDTGPFAMSRAKQEEFIRSRVNALPPNTSEATKRAVESNARSAWRVRLHNEFLKNPILAQRLSTQDFKRSQVLLKEWEVPMVLAALDKEKVFVQSVNVSLSNTLARHQVQLQQEPTYQHIGGGDSTVSFSLIVTGEAELQKLKRVFEVISGTARIEHAHAVLGFLGIKNVLTVLCGIKYVIPLRFNVDTIPNYPHVYKVQLDFTDFDIFQQKREILSAIQQDELTAAFGRANPFLRIKQLWGAMSAYPDFPLSVRDPEGKVVGHLDPDWYFKAFEVFDDDVHTPPTDLETEVNNVPKPASDLENEVNNVPAKQATTGAQFMDRPGVHNVLTKFKEPLGETITVTDTQKLVLRSGDYEFGGELDYNEPHAANTLARPRTTGTVPPSAYMQPYLDKGSNPMGQARKIMEDLQYREKSGRMVRAFPTYMLWMIDEAGKSYGVKLFDNFYGMQAVIDMSVTSSEDVLGDTLVLRISNSYGRLTIPMVDTIDDPERKIKGTETINNLLNADTRIITGLNPYGDILQMDTFQIKPGIRLHLRLGYSSNPGKLDTVFNGQVTMVTQGEILEITAQSDAIELSAIVNGADKKGQTGKIDGSVFGFHMSEPRDLMIRLLTMGSSGFIEYVSLAFKGQIFSDSKFGIRHFGSVLYEEDENEKKINNRAKGHLADSLAKIGTRKPQDLPQASILAQTSGIELMSTISLNLATKRDTEVFKRNIYPGNGLGVAQYLGGDISDGGIARDMAFSAGGLDEHGRFLSDLTSEAPKRDVNEDPLKQLLEFRAATQQVNPPVDPKHPNDKTPGYNAPDEDPNKKGLDHQIGDQVDRFMGVDKIHPLTDALGITTRDDDDVFDEVSFRASTYMKTVWDLMITCAALLPDYIVAVRPFEERSTLFYGKPHWTYTSGLIPLTAGPFVGNDKADAAKKQAERMIKPDADITDGIRDTRTHLDNPDRFQEGQLNKYLGGPGTTAPGEAGAPPPDPAGSNAGIGEPPPATAIGAPGGGTELLSSGATSSLSGRLSLAQVIQVAHAARFRGEALAIMGAIAMRESGGDAHAHNPRGRDNSYGLWQINMLGSMGPARRKSYGLTSNEQLWDPNVNARVAFSMSNGGKKFSDWSTYNNSAHLTRLSEAKQIVAGMGAAATTPPVGPNPPSNAAGSGAGSGGGVSVPVGTSSPAPAPTPAGAPPSAGTPDPNAPPPATGAPVDPKAAEEAANKSKKLQEQADEVIKEFKENFEKESICIDIFKKAAGEGLDIKLVRENIDSDSRNIVERNAGSILGSVAIPIPIVGAKIGNAVQDRIQGERVSFDNDAEGKKVKELYNTVMTGFKAFMLDIPENKAWLIKTADKQFNVLTALVSDTLVMGGLPAGPLFASAALGSKVYNVIDGAVGFITGHNNKSWNFDSAHNAWKIYLTEGKGATIAWMKANGGEGSLTTSFRGRLLGEALKAVGDPIAKIRKLLGSVYGGVMNLVQYALAQVSDGLQAAGERQAMTNRLNRYYNDSVYFQAGAPNSLARLADNPFTREYGEPVVEIRQPFQRMHYISSFQHILGNRITQNLDGVSTIVTATSNSEHPVTVHFDKGAPPESQKEKVIDTGLYWDSPKGWFGLSKFRHPSDFIRSVKKSQAGHDDEISSKRVALYHLKESLKDLYTGEIVVIGDASIRAHDLVYLADTYEAMSGLFEVEAVTHHFTPETGFITSIVPNALVTINDPGRWSATTWMQQRLVQQKVRSKLREAISLRADTANNLGASPREYSVNELTDLLSDEVATSSQFTGGWGKLVSDIAGNGAVGGFVGNTIGSLDPNRASYLDIFKGPSIIRGPGEKIWGAWEHVRDNIFDQHGCYIQYLQQNGQPMDSNLSSNNGVAVGQQNGITLVLGGARLGFLGTKDAAGDEMITTSKLLQNIGWRPSQIIQEKQHADIFLRDTYDNLRKMSGRFYNDLPGVTPKVLWGKVTKVIDGDTYHFAPESGGGLLLSKKSEVRMAVQAPEDKFKHLGLNGVPAYRLGIGTSDPGAQASEFSYNILIDELGPTYDSMVALRINPIAGQELEVFGRSLAITFINAPLGFSKEERKTFLMEAAKSSIDWQSFLKDGRPITLDNALLVSNHAQHYASSLKYNLAETER